MPVPLQTIRAALAHSAPVGNEPRWNDVCAELLTATSRSLKPEVEQLLLGILRFEGELQLNETSAMPHRMSPENMLKSLAVQALGRWTGVTYLPTMRRFETAASPALACVIRGVIQKVSTETGKVRPADAVPEIQTEQPFHIKRIVYGGGTSEEFTEREFGGMGRYEAVPLIRAFGMTFMPCTFAARQEQEA